MRELGDGSGDYLETDGLEFKMKVNNCIPLFEWINQDADTQKLDEEDVLNEQPGTQGETDLTWRLKAGGGK